MSQVVSQRVGGEAPTDPIEKTIDRLRQIVRPGRSACGSVIVSFEGANSLIALTAT